MAFLDLICCAFGGVILLYLIADRANETGNVAIESLQMVIIEQPGSTASTLGVRVNVGDQQHQCWPKVLCKGGQVKWDFSTEKTVAIILGGEISKTVDVFLLEVPDINNPPPGVCVRVSSPSTGLDAIVVLQRAEGYRASIPVNQRGGSCA